MNTVSRASYIAVILCVLSAFTPPWLLTVWLVDSLLQKEDEGGPAPTAPRPRPLTVQIVPSLEISVFVIAIARVC
jgi:hypothetical protein